MKRQFAVWMSLALTMLWAGCAGPPQGDPVQIPSDPVESLVWSSEPARPPWTMAEPSTSGGMMSFVGLSGRYATEKTSRDDAYRHALDNVVKYMGTIVKNKYELAATNFGLASDVVDPTLSARAFEKQLAVNIAKQVKVSNWYVEKWQTQTGVAYQTFALTAVPEAVVDESQRSTAADLAERAEQKAKAAKEANDEVAEAQAEKAAEFWKKMQEQGVAE